MNPVNFTLVRELETWMQQQEGRDGLLRLIVIGDSMGPLLLHQDTVIVSHIHCERLHCGDIVVRAGEDFVTHRFIKVADKKILTRGDARYWCDPPAGPDEVLGKVIRIERNEIVADLQSRRWRIANRIIGEIGRFQLIISGRKQQDPQNKLILMHQACFWLGKKAVWIILSIFANNWLRIDEARIG